MNQSRRVVPDLHPALVAAAAAAQAAYLTAKLTKSRQELAAIIGLGGDGTPTMFLDQIVDEAVVAAVEPYKINVLSEEIGWVDRGSSVTLVIDPVDGTANAVAGVPACAFAGAIVMAGTITDAHILWLDSQRTISAHRRRDGSFDVSEPLATTGRLELAGASIAMLRPRAETRSAWNRIVEPTERLRVMGSSVIEGSLVAIGAVDAFVDAGGDVHRLVDLLPLVPFVEHAGGVVVDAFDRPLEFDIDMSKRWSGIVAATRPLAEEIRSLIR
ncbi:MAG: inositol monophosphatase [Actinomycetota bacterium]|nr:inositol monophosphatase [Actinomycetota bacterium]MDA2970685.1 inositol monophosphatase [Actinomycetota bacterium]MDA3000703.1 inositol monophosphatase [Actinomycetota bacterium]